MTQRSINIEQLFLDYSIPIYTEGKNTQEGWINTTCPFCDDTSNHLGFEIDRPHFNCWHCGRHSIKETIAKLIGVSESEAIRIIRQYGGTAERKKIKVKIYRKPIKYPSGITPLSQRHSEYLSGRGFDPEYLSKEWNLSSTGPTSYLKDGSGKRLDYRNRIIAPIEWEDRVVSWQARDVTGKQILRYKACPQDYEQNNHQHILYGKQKKWKSTGICVEGITDVWRFGTDAFCVYGIEFTYQQIKCIAKYFKRVIIIFDNEPKAQRQAYKLKSELMYRNVEVEILTVENDPGSMNQKEANYLVKQLI